jgi:hypothetical protein
MYVDVCRTPFHDGKIFMGNAKRREVAETVFNRNQRREAEIDEALKQEYARREAAIKNMYRLRALRIARDEKAKTGQSSKPLARGHGTANASA